MKTVQQNYLDMFDTGMTSNSICVKIILTDLTEFLFTDYDAMIEFDGDIYDPESSFTPSSVKTNTNMAVDNMTFVGRIDSDLISEEDLRTGKLDFAEVMMFTVNHDDPDGFGMIKGLAGVFGQAFIEDNVFSLELRGITQLLQQKMGELYGIPCPAIFGDARCGLNASDPDYLKSLIVGNVTEDRRIFETGLTDADDYFSDGILTWTVGANAGTQMDVKKFLNTNGLVELYEPMPRDISVLDEATILVGCDGSKETCKTKFKDSNIERYRGFPYVVGITSLLRGI